MFRGVDSEGDRLEDVYVEEGLDHVDDAGRQPHRDGGIDLTEIP